MVELTGGLVHEYSVCPRAAWYSSRKVGLENELLILGRMIHERSYRREMKNVFGDNVALDFIKNKNGEIWVYEIKKSSKMLGAARRQLIFYLVWLKDRGVKAHGKIVVPAEKYNETVELDEKAEIEMKQWVVEIKKVLESKKPPERKRKNICEKCSYYELCWV